MTLAIERNATGNERDLNILSEDINSVIVDTKEQVLHEIKKFYQKLQPTAVTSEVFKALLQVVK